MTKQNKILLSVGIAGIAAYSYFAMRKKKYFYAVGTGVTPQAYFDQCVTTTLEPLQTASADSQPTAAQILEAKAGCCNKIAASVTRFENLQSATWNGSSCIFNMVTPPPPPESSGEAECIQRGGIWDGTTCTPCTDATHSIVNGVCVSDEELKCETSQGGTWVGISATNSQAYCACPRGSSMINGICTADVASTDTPDDTTDTPTDTPTDTDVTIVTPPPFFPGLGGSGSGGSGGGGGAEDEPITEEDLLDWIPWILAGMTTALSIVSEQKQA